MNTKSFMLLGTVTAILASCSSLAVKADDAMKAPASTIDYSALLGPKMYDYTDLKQATAAGYSTSQVATIAKIASKTGMSFHEILAAVERGATFPALAEKYNLRLQDIYDVTDEKAKIADYMAAYEATGKMAMMH